MNEISFRSAQLDDLPVLYEFEQGIVKTERPFDPTLKSGHINYYDLKAMIKSPEAEVLVAVIDSEIIGSGYVKIKPAQPYLKYEKFAYVGFMYVRPEHRRKGISQLIIGHLKLWAQERNMTELRLSVYSDNHIAVAAYEKLGMQKILTDMRIEI